MKTELTDWGVQFVKAIVFLLKAGLILFGLLVLFAIGCCFYFRCDCGSEEEEAPAVLTTPAPAPISLAKALP